MTRDGPKASERRNASTLNSPPTMNAMMVAMFVAKNRARIREEEDHGWASQRRASVQQAAEETYGNEREPLILYLAAEPGGEHQGEAEGDDADEQPQRIGVQHE
jgi:hypothetical protein